MTISDKYKGKHCEICGTGVDITKDHIIPKWLERRFAYFQFNVYMVNNEQYLCKEHNRDKGGIIDYEDERVRRFIKRFILMLQERVDVVEKKIKAEKAKASMEANKKKKTEQDKKNDKEVNGVIF